MQKNFVFWTFKTASFKIYLVYKYKECLGQFIFEKYHKISLREKIKILSRYKNFNVQGYYFFYSSIVLNEKL